MGKRPEWRSEVWEVLQALSWHFMLDSSRLGARILNKEYHIVLQMSAALSGIIVSLI